MPIPYSDILNQTAVKLSETTDEIEDNLDFLNDKLFELNTIDFCNPLGYIMGKALPPNGPVQQQIDKYAGKLKKFTDKLGAIDLKEKALNQLDENAGTTAEQLQRRQQTIEDLLEIKREIDTLDLPAEFIENIPGANKIAEKLAKLKVDLDIAEGIAVDKVSPLDILEKTKEFQALKKFLLPFTNPVNAINTFFADEVADVNKALRDFIRPDRFADDVEGIIKFIVKIEKLMQKIIGILQIINTIVKLCNILIKVYIILAKLLKKIPIPARWQTTGQIVKASTKANEMEFHKAKELQDFLKSVSNFLEIVIQSLAGVRKEILQLIVGLEQLKQNLSACPYTKDNYLQDAVDTVIVKAKSTLAKLEEQVPQLKDVTIPGDTPLDGNRDCHALYKGFCIRIEKEVVVDESITLVRRYATIKGPDGTITDETAPTYATKDSVLISEAKFLIDRYNVIESPDANPSTLEDAQVEQMLGISLDDVQKEENEAREGVQNLINEMVAEKNLQQELEKKKKEREKAKEKQESQPDEKKVKEVARLVNSLTVEDFYNIVVRKAGNQLYIGNLNDGKDAGKQLIRNLGNTTNLDKALAKAGNKNLVNSIVKQTTSFENNSFNFRKTKEARLDKKNLQSVINYLRIVKKYTHEEIQAGLQQTNLIKRANFYLDNKGRIRFKLVGG